MIVFQTILLAVGIVVVALVWLRLGDKVEKRRAARCVEIVGVAKCPRCNQVLGDAASIARFRSIKYTIGGGWKLFGHGRPSHLLPVTCANCQVELFYRLDGSLYRIGEEDFQD